MHPAGFKTNNLLTKITVNAIDASLLLPSMVKRVIIRIIGRVYWRVEKGVKSLILQCTFQRVTILFVAALQIARLFLRELYSKLIKFHLRKKKS